MTRFSNRRGFSLPEVLVATVLLGVIGGALTKLVVTQMRFFDNVGAVRGARSVARNSMNVLISDLRMVQDQNGVTAASTSSITVRVPYRIGMFCGSTGSATTVSMLPVDSAVGQFAKYAGYGWRNRTTGSYTVVSPANPVTQSPSASVSAATCTGTDSIKTVTVNGRPGDILDITPIIPSTTALGTPVFFYQTITYSFAASGFFPGKMGLWRSQLNGVNEELMAPFDATAGFKFYTSGSDASSSTVPSPLDNITGVELVLNAVGSRTPAGRTSPPQQKMVTAVFFKNIR